MSDDHAPPTPEELAVGTEEERNNALLTKIDRRFLWGVKDYDTPSQRSHRRAKIRDRVRAGFADFTCLPLIEPRKRKEIFDQMEPGELRRNLASLIEFVHLGMDGDIEWLEETIASGVSSAEGKRESAENTFYSGSTVHAGVDVDIEITRGYDVDEIEQRFREGQGHTLTPAEVGVLVRKGRLDDGDLQQLQPGDTRKNPLLGEPDYTDDNE